MGKQQSVLEYLEARVAAEEGTTPIADEKPSVLEQLEARVAAEEGTAIVDPEAAEDSESRFSKEAAKIDKMTNEELFAYIEASPGGRTKSDKPLPDRASSGRPVQAFEKGALALSDVKLSDDKVKKIKEEGQLLMGDNTFIMSRFQNLFGKKTPNDFSKSDDPAKAADEYNKFIKTQSDYLEGRLNPAALKLMSSYSGNENLDASFNTAFDLSTKFVNDLERADLLKAELEPYFNNEKQAKSQAQLDALNVKNKEYQALMESLSSQAIGKKNKKGELVPTDLFKSIAELESQNTWSYDNVQMDKFGFDENGAIVTGKEWKRNSQGINIVNEIKTDARSDKTNAAYNSIVNIDDTFEKYYTEKVNPIYKSFLTNAFKKLDSKNPDMQRASFDILMGALSSTEVLPYAQRTIDRIRRAGSYDDQIEALKSFYGTPITSDGTLLQSMIKRTNKLKKSQLVLNYAKTNFGQHSDNYPTTFNETEKSQADWLSFATNGTLQQLQQDRKEWNNSALEIKELMDAYIMDSDDIKNVIESQIEFSEPNLISPDQRKINTSLNNKEGKALIVDAARQMVGNNNKIVPYSTWVQQLVNQDNDDKLGGDKFSRLFGAVAFDWATSGGTYSVYVNDQGNTIMNESETDTPMVTPPKGYKPITLHMVTLASDGQKPKRITGSGRRSGLNPIYRMANNNASSAFKQSRKFYDEMSSRIKGEYDELNTAYANDTTLKLSGLGSYGGRGLMQYGLDMRMSEKGKGAIMETTLATNTDSQGSSDLSTIGGDIKDLGYENPKLNLTNKHKNIRDGIFKLIAPRGRFMDYNDPNFVSPITNTSGSYRSHMGQGANKIITVTNTWDNNAMGEGAMFTDQNADNNKKLLQDFFQQGDKESNEDYEKRMGDVDMTFRRIGMEKDKATYQFTDANNKSIFINIPINALEESGESFYKYTGKSVGEKEFEITGEELLPMPTLDNGDNAFNEDLILRVKNGMYVVDVSYTDAKGNDVKVMVPTQLPESITSLPDARKLTGKLIENIVDQRIKPINQ